MHTLVSLCCVLPRIFWISLTQTSWGTRWISCIPYLL